MKTASAFCGGRFVFILKTYRLTTIPVSVFPPDIDVNIDSATAGRFDYYRRSLSNNGAFFPVARNDFAANNVTVLRGFFNTARDGSVFGGDLNVAMNGLVLGRDAVFPPVPLTNCPVYIHRADFHSVDDGWNVFAFDAGWAHEYLLFHVLNPRGFDKDLLFDMADARRLHTNTFGPVHVTIRYPNTLNNCCRWRLHNHWRAAATAQVDIHIHGKNAGTGKNQRCRH